MAFAKSGKGGNQEVKSLRDVSGEPTSGLRSIEELSLSNERQDQGVKASHDFGGVADRHASCIFFQSDVASIM